jgi:phosphatidylinositol alpha-1,6-mannosyltransferase
MKHVLVTNDFPPKIGGIQSLLWEWWRRLPPDSFAVLTSPHSDAAQFDAEQGFRIERTREPVLLPHPWMVQRINALAKDFGADFVVVDPALPLGLVGPWLKLPYMVVLHGAEVTVPGRIPVSQQVLGRVLRGADHVIAAGGYPAREGMHAAGQMLNHTIIAPGVDTKRFVPLDKNERHEARRHFGWHDDDEIVLGISRLVPRKGFDILIRAIAQVAPHRRRLKLVIASTGRDEERLKKIAQEVRAPVEFLGRVPHEDLPRLYGSADVFSMMCRNRWGGLEQEGFGIVFVEAAACGVPQIAGNSGGAAEAVLDQVTGYIMDDPTDVAGLAARITTILDEDALRASMAIASRDRAVTEFDYDVLGRRLGEVLKVGPQ